MRRNKMFPTWKKILTLVILGFAVIIVISVFSALAATNTVPDTWADQESRSISADLLKPSECSGITLTNIVDIGAGETGTDANDLILGTRNNDAEILGGAGDDCILGGKGTDRQRIDKVWGPGIFGEEGNDVIIGGPGNQDHCDGGAGNDTYYSCETTY
jgi:Ca2+-binding RTX toxin-like protein